MDSRGWSDIAYNFIVCNHGVTFEGRGWDTQNGASGNAAANDTRLAVCWAGHSDLDVFDIRAANEIHAVAREGFARGWPKVFGGHRDFSQTTCPGNTLYNWMKAQTWEVSVGTPIMGPPQASQSQALSFVIAGADRRGGAEYDNQKLSEIVSAYFTVGVSEGVRPEVGLAQSCKETGFYTYTGDVHPDQNNFAGIGATGGGVRGESWPNVTAGVQGHLRRLHLYAVSQPSLHNLAIMKRALPSTYWGKAPNVEDLGTRWAPSPTYGSSVVADYLKPLLDTSSASYPDLVGHWSEAAARKAIEKGVMVGDGQNWFPDKAVSRGELATVLVRVGLL
jgi:hypothetical protein